MRRALCPTPDRELVRPRHPPLQGAYPGARAADAGVSMVLHWLQNTVAGDCNQPQRLEEVFRRGRYHATLVEADPHVNR